MRFLGSRVTGLRFASGYAHLDRSEGALGTQIHESTPVVQNHQVEVPASREEMGFLGCLVYLAGKIGSEQHTGEILREMLMNKGVKGIWGSPLPAGEGLGEASLLPGVLAGVAASLSGYSMLKDLDAPSNCLELLATSAVQWAVSAF